VGVTIAVVNFVAAYIPYLGAWTAGGFTVLIALQQLIQPIAITAGPVPLRSEDSGHPRSDG
jgi:predicted PurR-regulated permease PerM